MEVLLRPVDLGLTNLVRAKITAAGKEVKAGLASMAEGGQASAALISAGLVVAGAAAAAFAVKSTSAFLTVGKEVLKLQRSIGGTPEEVSKLRFAAQQTGTSVDQLTIGIRTFSRTIAASKDVLNLYGIGTRDASGKTLQFHDVLLNTAEVFSKMPEGPTKTALAVQLFGRAGQQLLPLLDRGRAGILALEHETEKYGLVLTQGNLNAVKQSITASRQQTAALQGLEVQVGAHVIPVLTALEKVATGLIVGFEDVAKVVGKVFSVLGPFKALLYPIIGPVQALFGALSSGGKSAAAATDEYQQNVAALVALGVASKVTADDVETLAESVKVDLTQATADQIDLLQRLVSGPLPAASSAALRFATANRILASSQVDATAKAAAFKEALDSLIGVQVAATTASNSYATKFKAAQDAFLHGIDVTRQLEDARLRLRAADSGLADAEQAVALKAASNARGIVDANTKIRDSTSALLASRLQLVDAERALLDLTNPSPLTKEDATVGVSEAKNNSARATIRLQQAEAALLALRRSSTATADDLYAAELDVSDAKNAQIRATESLAAAQQKLNSLYPDVIRNSRAYYDAQSAVVAASRAASDASVNLARARQDETILVVQQQHDLAVAQRDVTAATVEQQRAGQDLAKLVAGSFVPTIDQSTEAGRANLDIITGLVTATQDEANAIVAVTGNMEAGKAIIAAHIGQISTLLHQWGLTDDQVARLLATYNLLPDAIAKVNQATNSLSGLDVHVQVNRTTTTGTTSIPQSSIPKNTVPSSPIRTIPPSKPATAHAVGALVTSPELAYLAEAGPELVLPLTNPARMRQLISQAGVAGFFSSPAAYAGGQSGSTAGGGTTVTFQAGAIQIILPPGATPADAARLGDAAGNAARRAALGQRAAVLTRSA